MTIKVYFAIDELISKKWWSFLQDNNCGNFFQSPEAFLFFEQIINYKPFVIYCETKSTIVGLVTGVLIKETNGPKGYLSRRCVVWGGPLVSTNEIEVTECLLRELNNSLSSETIFTEFRNFRDMSNVAQLFENLGYNFEERVNIIVPISDIDTNKKIISTSRKRQINKGLKAGAEIIEAESQEQIKEFYEILKRLYNEKVKKPLPSLQFFIEFYKNKNLGKYLLINYKNKIIGGIMCPIYKETIYEWYVCGLDIDYKDVYPSVLATWSAIEYAAKNGLHHFDFMGAGKPDEDYGVREFKSKFGGNLVNYGRFVKINKPLLYSIGKTGLKLYQKLK